MKNHGITKFLRNLKTVDSQLYFATGLVRNDFVTSENRQFEIFVSNLGDTLEF